MDQLASEVLLLVGRQAGVSGDVDYSVTKHHPIGADHLGDGQGRGDLDYRDSGLLEFGCDRSAAASAGPSSRREDHRVNALVLDLLDHLLAHAPGVGQRVGEAGCGYKLVV